jgi:putative ABC transporter-associated repeat protein
MRRRRYPAVALLALAVALVPAGGPVGAQESEGESSPVEAGEAIGDEQVVIADGHIDVGPRFLDGTFTLLVRDDTVEPSLWRRPPDVVLHATDAAVVQVPDDPAFAFLGAPGAEVWLLPQVQQPGIVWPGWNTQDPEVATTLRREVTWTLNGVDGPGALVLFVNQDFGQPATIFDSREAYPQQTGIDLNTHAHGNWVFTAPGVYRLDLEMSATTVEGDEVAAAGTLQVAVGDATDPQAALAAADAGEVPLSTTAPDDPAGDGTDEAAPDPAAEEAGGNDDVPPVLALAGGVALLALVAGVVLAVRARRRAGAGGS